MLAKTWQRLGIEGDRSILGETSSIFSEASPLKHSFVQNKLHDRER